MAVSVSEALEVATDAESFGSVDPSGAAESDADARLTGEPSGAEA
jgi:hypothetical protein